MAAVKMVYSRDHQPPVPVRGLTKTELRTQISAPLMGGHVALAGGHVAFMLTLPTAPLAGEQHPFPAGKPSWDSQPGKRPDARLCFFKKPDMEL